MWLGFVARHYAVFSPQMRQTSARLDKFLQPPRLLQSASAIFRSYISIRFFQMFSISLARGVAKKRLSMLNVKPRQSSRSRRPTFHILHSHLWRTIALCSVSPSLVSRKLEDR